MLKFRGPVNWHSVFQPALLQGAHVSEERALSAVGVIKKDTQDHTFLSCVRIER